MSRSRPFGISWPAIGLLVGVLLVLTLGKLALAQVPIPTPIGADPDAGLSREEKDARYKANTSAYEAKYREWHADFVKSNPDISKLPRIKSPKLHIPSIATMQEATVTAEVIIVGSAQKVEFEAFAGAFVTIRVDSVVKGPRNLTNVTVWMGGTLRPTPDFKSAHLAIDENSPLLFPGEKAVLFLMRTNEGPRPGSYYPQSYTGVYNIADGRVKAVPGNSFRSAVDGQLESAFISNIRALIP